MRISTLMVLALGGLAAYLGPVRRWMMHWGATEDEIARAMPLDDRVQNATAVSTRAVTIRATPEEVWRWIVQMGDKPRAGYYSYAFIERMQGMEIEGAERILRQFQELREGQALDAGANMLVHYVDAPRFLVLGPSTTVEWMQSTWAFGLYPLADGATRLVTRVRARVSYRAMMRAVPAYLWPLWLFIEPGVFVMERKMLLEIRRLAERGAGHADGVMERAVQ
jgi:hypothetical protein